jgi:hypothetical protein
VSDPAAGNQVDAGGGDAHRRANKTIQSSP